MRRRIDQLLLRTQYRGETGFSAIAVHSQSLTFGFLLSRDPRIVLALNSVFHNFARFKRISARNPSARSLSDCQCEFERRRRQNKGLCEQNRAKTSNGFRRVQPRISQLSDRVHRTFAFGRANCKRSSVCLFMFFVFHQAADFRKYRRISEISINRRDRGTDESRKLALQFGGKKARITS